MSASERETYVLVNCLISTDSDATLNIIVRTLRFAAMSSSDVHTETNTALTGLAALVAGEQLLAWLLGLRSITHGAGELLTAPSTPA